MRLIADHVLFYNSLSRQARRFTVFHRIEQKIQRIDFLLSRVQLFQQELPVLPEQLELFPKSASGPEPEEPVYLQ